MGAHKALGLTAWLVAALWSVGVAAQEPAPEADRGELLDGIVAVVGDEVVTRSELAQALAFPAALLKARKTAGLPADKAEEEFGELQRETRDNLVDNKLILLSAKADGMSVDEEVKRRMEKLRSGFGNDRKRLEQYLESQGFGSLEEYERQMSEELLRQRVVFGQIRPRAEVTEKELEAAFEERYAGEVAQKAGCKGAYIRHHTLEQIFYPLTADASARETLALYTTAYRCYLGLVEGTVTMANVATACAGQEVTPSQGSLGEVDETKSFAPNFQEAFDKLVSQTEQEYSEPFIIKDGIRILHLTATRRGCVDDAEEISRLKDRLKAKLEEEKFERVLDWWLQQLRGKFRVDIKKL